MKNIKKSYIKIFIFELLSLIILFLSDFKSSILSVYKIPIILLVLNFIFVLLLGFEKSKKRYTGLIVFELIKGIVIFLLLFYLSGIIITFSRVDNYFTLYGISNIIIPILLTIVFKELLRNLLLTKCGNNKLLIVLTTIFFIMVDVISPLTNLDVNKKFDLYIFVSCSLLPAITTNIFMTYLVEKAGYEASISYLIILSMYQYLLPIIPNPSKYLKKIIDLLLPVLLMFRIIKILKNPHSERLNSESLKKNNNLAYIFPIMLTFIFVYFVSGYFRYSVVAIASGSMHPTFDRGDIVVVEMINDKYNNSNLIKEGAIVAFKTENNIIVVHRIVKVVKDHDTKYFYTKGDFNNSIDDNILEYRNIIGVVKNKIKFIGYPTVWLSEI